MHTNFVHQVSLFLLLISSGVFGEGEGTDYIRLKKEYTHKHTHTLFVLSSAPNPWDCKDAYVLLKFLILMSVVIYIKFIK